MGVDTTPLVEEVDVRWWLDLAPRLEWIFAKTYAETAPHSYVVHVPRAVAWADDG